MTPTTTPTTTTPATEAPQTIVTQAAPAPEPLTAQSFTVPEGLSLDPAFLEIMNNAEFTPAQRGQALLELQAGLATKSEEARSQAWKDQLQTWENEVANHPVLGGANLPTTLAGIGRLMDTYAPATTEEGKAIRQAFDETGAGNHPGIVSFLFNLSKQLKEPTMPGTGAPAGQGRQPLAKKLYNNPSSNLT